MTESHGPYSYRVTEEQVARAAYKVARKRLFKPPSVYLAAAIPVLCVLLLIVDLADGYLNLASLAVLVAAPLAAFLALRVMIPMAARRQYRQSPALRDEHQLAFDSEKITFSGTRGTTTHPLGEIHAFSQLPGLVLLHITEGYFTAVSSEAMPDAEVAALVDALDGAGVTRW